jgi:hypothetical protein
MTDSIFIIYFIYKMTIKNQRTIFAIIAIVAAMGLAATVATSNPAYADISPVNSGCTNPSGFSPPGQQLTCTGGGLTQQ